MSPEQQADDLYLKYSEFETLTVEEVKKCCVIAIVKIMEDSDTLMRDFWLEVIKFINRRGKK